MNQEKKKLTASYEMTNVITGSKHWYYVFRKVAGFPRDQIHTKFMNDLKQFPAYTTGMMYVSSDIIITDYRDRQVDLIKANL